ncbi:MAG: glycosyl transferase family 1 [Microbacterium sp. 14-71-5]|nr:MAG: glycosyl transferase family 1 [Microbacterium sp. 14-71-5]
MADPVRVALTVEQCWQPVPGGSGTYVAALTEALAGRSDVDLVGLAARHPDGAEPRPAPSGAVRHSQLPRVALYEAWNRLRRPLAESTTGAVDVVHATTWALPGHRAPLVVTVHDLAFLRDPGHFTRRGNSYFRRALDLVRAEAAQVVVPSAMTARDCGDAGIDRSRVTVVPHGVRARQVSEADRVAWRRRYGVDRPYVLWCGTLEPRKNVDRLVAAFAAARAEGALDTDLVLVGPSGWGDAENRVADALTHVPSGSVHLLGRLSDEDLQVAYSGATCFAFPSLWEGFGMPVLEAMAHGVPVVTSAGSAMAEFAGEVGWTVDPTDVDAIAGALVDAARSSTAGAASARAAARYTWSASADAHVGVYRRAGR